MAKDKDDLKKHIYGYIVEDLLPLENKEQEMKKALDAVYAAVEDFPWEEFDRNAHK